MRRVTIQVKLPNTGDGGNTPGELVITGEEGNNLAELFNTGDEGNNPGRSAHYR